MLFSPSTSQALAIQCIGRNLRCDQARAVYVYEYRVPGTFNIYLANRNLRKALPGEGFTVEGWVVREGRLVKLKTYEKPRETDLTDPDTIMDEMVKRITWEVHDELATLHHRPSIRPSVPLAKWNN
ncbi:hypothetical protein AAWM_04391 [Aspergillus awamori]|uniref:Uncharacterized protein n=1 Tax=Aspergillus awamori TaxID=105351 RepID=A0A401KQF1_ASPAW|nr:hypothetical protein AAWM_04391 [Aspergillus awamori]